MIDEKIAEYRNKGFNVYKIVFNTSETFVFYYNSIVVNLFQNAINALNFRHKIIHTEFGKMPSIFGVVEVLPKENFENIVPDWYARSFLSFKEEYNEFFPEYKPDQTKTQLSVLVYSKTLSDAQFWASQYAVSLSKLVGKAIAGYCISAAKYSMNGFDDQKLVDIHQYHIKKEEEYKNQITILESKVKQEQSFTRTTAAIASAAGFLLGALVAWWLFSAL